MNHLAISILEPLVMVKPALRFHKTRGMDVFLVQSTYQPGNEHLMQLLLMADACKRASANSVSAVIPYFGYSRQDRRPRNTRGPVSAKLVADLIETADIKRLITVDLHADQIEGFFSIPVDNIYSSTILMSDMWRQGYPDQVIVSPDVGGVKGQEQSPED